MCASPGAYCLRGRWRNDCCSRLRDRIGQQRQSQLYDLYEFGVRAATIPRMEQARLHPTSDTLAAGTLASHPLYKEVKIRLTRGLAAGEWKAGQAIPSESRLAQRFNVSVGTIRKAIDELVAERILLRQQGRGTFVATHTEDRTLFYFFHIV